MKKQIFLGYYRTELEAALAYDKASIQYRGTRGKVNFMTSFKAFAEREIMENQVTDQYGALGDAKKMKCDGENCENAKGSSVTQESNPESPIHRSLTLNSELSTASILSQ